MNIGSLSVGCIVVNNFIGGFFCIQLRLRIKLYRAAKTIPTLIYLGIRKARYLIANMNLITLRELSICSSLAASVMG